MDFDADYIQLTADHLQSYHYFETMHDNIRRIFSFSPNLRKKIDKYANSIFK
jgi:hypothetical protein